jgi:RNA polymerase-binding protein DksA
MARSTGKSLAGQAASAARKIISGRTTPDARESNDSVPAKQVATAAKAPARKTAAPARNAATAKKAAAPARNAATAKKAASPTKNAATAKKAAPPARNAATAKKTAPPAKNSAPATRKAAMPAKTTPPPKKAAAKKVAPAKKTAAKKASPAKKAATRKAPASALVVKEGEESWTKTELKEVLDELHAQREHSHEIIEKQESELTGLMRDAGDGAGHDQADMGATSFERDHELTVLSNERDKLAQIDRALGRIDDGTYGVCESCGNPIGKMRLMAFPRATLCLTCKQREERR